MVKWNRPFNCYSNDTDKLYKNSVTIQKEIVEAENGSIVPQENCENKFKISITRTDPTPCLRKVEVEFHSHNFLAYHYIQVKDEGVSIVFQFVPECRAPFVIFTKYGHKPTIKDFDDIFLPTVDRENGTYSVILTIDSYSQDNSTLYVAVGHLANRTEPDNTDWYNLTATDMTNRFLCNYSYCLFSTGCYYFDPDKELWITDGCQVEAVSPTETNCSCDHLTSFAAGFFVAPNTVDFDYVLAHADFSQNITIYLTLICTFVIYICLLIWARWKDKKDVEKLGATPLPDNDPKDKYVYEILVFTGHQNNAGTKSKVYFMVSGEDDETEVRTLADGKRPILRSGNVDVFVMATSRSLGDLFYLRIWHDNSGKGKWASWYLKYIVFRDVQTGQKYEFIANKWFAVEEGDGLIDRLLPVAGKEQKTEFTHLFSTTSRQKLSDSHLWFSVFLRPPRSRFTRVQRVSCCMAVLYLSMLVNAMWYQRTSNQPSPGAFKLGPFSLTMEQVMVGIMSNFVVFPPSFLMIFFFRKSRPRKLRPSRIEEALKKQRSEWQTEFGEATHDRGRGSSQPVTDSSRKLEKAKKKRKFTLPWWCVIFGWFFVLASIGVSIFFLWAYGIQFGNEKTSRWLTALVISFFSSVLLTQPIKIFLIAMFLSMVCQKLDYDEDDADEDEEDPRLEKDEEWLHLTGTEPVRPQRHMYRPLDPKAIEAARQQREKELRLHSLMKEICGYGAFLWLVIVMCMAERDPNGYYMRLNLINDFIKPGDLWNDFNKVNTEVRFWNWTEEALIPELIAGNWYNDRPPLGLRGFLDDRNNLKISYAIMRQIRIKPDSCAVAQQIKELTPECAGYGSIIFEDGGLYGASWNPNFTAETGTPPEYKYLTARQLKGYPFWGMMDYYSGGGYVVPLFEKQDEVRHIVKRLQRDGWIGRHTRAVFIEISVYNAQVNLFAAVTIVAEFLPGGGITPYYHIDPIRLLFYHNNSGTFFLVVQIIFLVFVLYITIRELRTFYKQRTKYFDQYWNVCHFSILMFSYAGIAIFVYRLILTQGILKIFRETEGTGYVKLQEAVLYNCLLSYVLAFLMFLATLQFLKLLRFNKRMGILALTLKKVAEELRSFGICLMVVFVAFVFLFWLLLGRFMWEFSTFVLSFESCISMLLKKFKYPEMAAAAPLFVPIVFFIFSISAAMVMINILLTIIIQSFEDVKQDMAKDNRDSEILRFAINRVKLMVGIGRSTVQPLPRVVPTTKTVSTQDTLKAFPSKVDQLLQFVNNVYFDSQIDFDRKDILKKMKAGQYPESGKRKPDVLGKYGSHQARKQFGDL